MVAAEPKYEMDQRVVYVDQHGRVQSGRVTRIEASWNGWVADPLIIYTVEHPTYRNKRMYAAEDRIRYSQDPRP